MTLIWANGLGLDSNSLILIQTNIPDLVPNSLILIQTSGPNQDSNSLTMIQTNGPDLDTNSLNPGIASSMPVRSHTFVEIDHEIISTVILPPSADLFKKGCCQLQAKVCARITG